jgi:predicted MFS family arabinose efflux permease
MLDQGHPPAQTEPSPSPWLVPILTFGVAVAVLSARALVVFLPVLAADLGTSVSLLGQVPASMLLLAGVLALVAGPLADRYGFRRTLVVGLLTVVVSAVATGLAPNLPILLAVTLVGAVARASVLPTAQAVVVTAFADEDARRRAVSWVSTGIATPTIIGIPLMTMIAGLTNWRVSFFLMGGMALVAAVCLQRTLTDSGPRTAEPLRVRSLLDSYKPLRRHRPTVLVVLATLAADTGLWCTTTYLSSFLVQRHGFSIEDAGWVFLAIGLLAMLGTVLGGGRIGGAPRPLLIGCRAWSALCLGASFALPVSWPVSVGLFLLAAPTIGLADLATTLVLTGVSPAGQATTLTLRSAAVCIGSALGGIVGGLLLALSDYPALGLCSLTLLLVATALVWGARSQAAPTPSVGTA